MKLPPLLVCLVLVTGCGTLGQKLDTNGDGVITQEEVEPVKDTTVGVVTSVGGPAAGAIAELLFLIGAALFGVKSGTEALKKKANATK